MRTPLVLSTVGLVVFFTTTAFADVAPPEGYVEACTVAKKQTATSECVQCLALRSMYDNADRCSSLLSPYCFVKECSAWGGAAYPEVWCRARSESSPAVPADVTSQLGKAGAPDLAVAVGGVARESCAPYTPAPIATSTGAATSTGTATSTGIATSTGTSVSAGGSGCEIPRGGSAAHGWAFALAGLAAVGISLIRRPRNH